MPMGAARLRAWRAHKQGLDVAVESSNPAAVLEKCGWARSVGGAAPYLTLFARARISRDEADAALARLDIHELPSARGCTYVVPAAHYRLALTVGESFAIEDRRLALKLGVTGQEIDRLCAKVLDTLAGGALDPAGIKAAAGGKVRSLGLEGRKKGLSNTLPVALSVLQSAGEIRRISTNGRLDTQRYQYALWRPNPRSGARVTQQEALSELARLYWQWIGPASLDEFKWFSGCSLKAIREAVAPLHLVPAREDTDQLVLPGELERLLAFQPARKPLCRLVSSLDSIVLLRRNVADVLPDPTAHIALLKGLGDLPSNAIIDRGALIGLWEYDPEAEEIAWFTFAKAGKEAAAEVTRVAEYIRTQLGDARTFSLDTPQSRAPRIQALRRAAEG